MNKKRIFILTALILAVCLVFSMFAMACDKKGDNNQDDNSKTTLLFTNGTFANGTSDSALTSPSNWTGAAGSTSSSTSATYTPSDADALTKGVVSTSSSGWNDLKKKYSHISSSSPGSGPSSKENEELKDDKILMINNRKPTSYRFTSDSHSLDANSYYKLSVDVRTLLDADNTDELAGAYIYVNGAAYAAWEAIDTKNAWETYTAYIETSEITSGSITVVLSLGIGNKQTGHLTKGYAFFDNVVLEKISEVDEDDEDAKAYTKEDFDKQTVTETVAKYTMKVADGEFDYASSTTSIPYTPSKYTQVSGFGVSGSGETANTSSSYLTKGIIDRNTFSKTDVKNSLSYLSKSLESAGQSLDKLANEPAPGSAGSRMLYIQNKQATAFGYRADVEMNFDLNKFYKVSVYARTYLEKGKASIRLTDGTNSDSNNFVIEVDTNGEWKEYSFYVAANQFRASTLKLELWLGYGGLNDTDTHALGAVLFDHTTIEEIKNADYEKATDSETISKIDLLTSDDDMEPIDLENFAIQNPDELNNKLKDRFEKKVIDTDDFTPNEYFKENPGKPVDIDNSTVLTSDVLAINNFKPTATTLSNLTAKKEDGKLVFDTSKLLPIAPNKAYAISMYVKTKDIDSSQGVTISLLRYNEEYKLGQKFEEAFTTLSSFSNLNTENLEDEKGFNDYTLVTFYVLGEQLKEARLGISITLGTGDGSDYSTLTMGYAFVSSMYVESIPYSQYSSASSSTTVKTVALADSNNSGEISSNGSFNNIDISATNNLFGNDIFDEYGMMKSALALPTNWSINSSSSISKDSFDNMAGVLNLNNKSQIKALLNTEDESKVNDFVSNFYNNLDKSFTTEKRPTVLAIKKDDILKKLGFTSDSISLSSNSYYVFMVYAKAEKGHEFSLTLKTATATNEDYKFATITGDGAWHQYMVFIETGISSASVTLSLNAGSDLETSSPSSSMVFFTNATYSSINEDVFKKAKDQSNKDWLTESWLVDSFDDVNSADSISSAKNFTGELLDSDANSDSDVLVSGVIDKNKTDYTDLDLDVDNTDGKDAAIIDAIFNNKNTNVGDRVLVIYNKDATAYGYTSNTANITPGKYYKISVWVLTYKLALNGNAGDDIDKNFVPTATITLKANNKTYEFGKKLTKDSSDNDKNRIVNTSTYDADGKETIGEWTEYSFYIFAQDDIDDTTATLSVSLGFKGKDYYLTGYVFVDNFSVEEIDEENFIARKDVYQEAEDGNYVLRDGEYVEITEANPAQEGETLYKKLTDSEVAKDDNDNNSILADETKIANNYRIVFTSEDSKAEPPVEAEPPVGKTKDPLLWLYISLGVVSGIIVVIVVIYLIKKFIPKKKKKLIKNSQNKKTSNANNSKRDQFGK